MIAEPHVKINLGLYVLRKRPDGYHDLSTLFVPYHGIRDVLEITAGDDYSRTSAHIFASYRGDSASGCPKVAQAVSGDGKLMVTVAREEGVDWNPLNDLTAKAYALLSEDFQLPPAKIFLEKRSPVGAGLGGGSSDGAFTLRMMSELFGLGLDVEKLAGYAARMGSDCPFFLYDTPMTGSGRGDELKPYPLDLAGYEIRVAVPDGIYVSTAQAYRGVVPAEPDITLEEVLARPVVEWKDLLRNDFEPSVFASFPALADIKRHLYEQGAVYASMSGSGSALFGIFPRE